MRGGTAMLTTDVTDINRKRYFGLRYHLFGCLQHGTDKTEQYRNNKTGNVNTT
jgi:hypothetical protein